MDVNSHCSGCGACKFICPTSSLEMILDKKGFYKSCINNSSCINCNYCHNFCEEKVSSTNPVSVYALKNKNDNIRLKSSSGGFIYELAKFILKSGGVVFGVAFNNSFKVQHVMVDRLQDISKIQGSKYVQSDTGRTFEMVKESLQQDKLVLFTGTPCQISGLIKYLNHENVSLENLLTCDNVCHGVVSPLVFEEYKKILEKEYNSKLKEFTFRYKCDGRTQNVKAVFENGKEYIGKGKNDLFYKIFFKNTGYCEACYNCKYANLDRIADFTIGDFWGIEKSILNFDDGYGVSLLLINNLRAQKFFEKIKDKFIWQISTVENCMQPNLQGPTPKGYHNDAFWDCFINNNLEKAMEVIDE